MSKRPNRKKDREEPPLLTKRDLRGFETEARDLLLLAQEKGIRIRVSARGHAILLGDNGMTASIPRSLKLQNRGAQNSRAAVARLIRGKGVAIIPETE